LPETIGYARADWLQSFGSAAISDQLSLIELVSNGDKQGSNRYGQDIVWDDLSLIYLP
jgi:hypothetical protein